jgi:uncharacterized repeat protein (TIGR04076 family)
MKLVIEVIDIQGRCPVYKIGEKIVLDDGYRVNLKKTDNICLHSLASLLPYYNALTHGVSAKELGLSGSGKEAYIQCLDPEKYTGGGTVTFKVRRKRF